MTLSTFLSTWYMAAAFLAAAIAVLGRAARFRHGRLAWGLLGTGLLFYSSGSFVFNLVPDQATEFPALADILWLCFYPLAFAALLVLISGRLRGFGTALWLDAAIVAGATGAAVSAVAFNASLEASGGGAALGTFAYTIGDVGCLALIAAVAGLLGWRVGRYWFVLGAGFCLIATADALYVVQAIRGDWAPGSLIDTTCSVGTLLLAAGAWCAPRERQAWLEPRSSRIALPIGGGLIALSVTAVATFSDMNRLATTLAFATLLAVGVRAALVLNSLTRQRARLSKLAATDSLTGLANHRTLHERLAEAALDGGSVSVVALDLDHFKRINDTYGHSQGDAVLRAIAARLEEEVRPGDLVGRLGGEEFALVLPGMPGDQAFATAERCRRAIEGTWTDGIRVSCSAGVASCPSDDPDGRRLMEMADGAMYLAKRTGRGRTCRFDHSQVNLLSSEEQHAQVRELLDSPGGFGPVFQPIVELATGRVGGYEALTRFAPTPVRPPDAWFEQARRSGLGPALEARAIAAALAVPGRPAGTFLALNLSPAALVSAEVAAVLPVDLGDIIIELTENELFSSDESLEMAVAELRARGARIAVDDAGAGYAGLQQLVRIKPEILKLDRSLVRDLQSDPAKIALLEALATFATTTGAAVCAEGIEHPDELLTLSRLDVTYAQGFALARPGPAWPAVASEIAEIAASDARGGMRVTPELPAGESAPVTLGQVSGSVANVRTRGDLDESVRLMERLIHSDDVAVSMLMPGERSLEALTEHDWDAAYARYDLDDYPTTEYVLTHSEIGQLVAGDPAADSAEVALLADAGFAAVLIAPIIHRCESVGLLEVYRREPRPWTPGEVDSARVFAHQLGPVLRAGLDRAERV